MTKWRIALFVSLLLNLFLAAALAAGFVTLRKGGGMINAGSLRIAGAELPETQRHLFRRALRETRREMRPELMASRQAKTQAAELLRQPVPNQAAINAALDRARGADMAVRAAVERRAVDFAAGLGPADRAKLADAMEKRGKVRTRE